MKEYYCGPSWAPQWIRRIASSKFNASCRVHDLDYTTHRFTRTEADRRFLQHMLRQARGNLVWETLAVIYYLLVRVFGALSWRDHSAGRSH